MVLSRNVERARLSFPVRPLDGFKVNLAFLQFLLNISGTLQTRVSFGNMSVFKGETVKIDRISKSSPKPWPLGQNGYQGDTGCVSV